MVKATSSAVKSSPLWNFTPSRSLNSQVLSSTSFQEAASAGVRMHLRVHRDQRIEDMRGERRVGRQVVVMRVDAGDRSAGREAERVGRGLGAAAGPATNASRAAPSAAAPPSRHPPPSIRIGDTLIAGGPAPASMAPPRSEFALRGAQPPGSAPESQKPAICSCCLAIETHHVAARADFPLTLEGRAGTPDAWQAQRDHRPPSASGDAPSWRSSSRRTAPSRLDRRARRADRALAVILCRPPGRGRSRRGAGAGPRAARAWSPNCRAAASASSPSRMPIRAGAARRNGDGR